MADLTDRSFSTSNRLISRWGSTPLGAIRSIKRLRSVGLGPCLSNGQTGSGRPRKSNAEARFACLFAKAILWLCLAQSQPIASPAVHTHPPRQRRTCRTRWRQSIIFQVFFVLKKTSPRRQQPLAHGFEGVGPLGHKKLLLGYQHRRHFGSDFFPARIAGVKSRQRTRCAECSF